MPKDLNTIALGGHRESSNDYRGELFRLGNWRVAVCKDRLQWLLQRHTRPGAPDGGRWEAQRFCTTRKALIREWKALTGDDGAVLLAVLPEHIKDAGEGTA